jgi:hypothetical protein
VPVVTEDGTSVDIPGILALRDKTNDLGDNLVAVWYENPGVAGAPWPAKAWESKDQWDAIKWVKEEFSIDNGYDLLWPTIDPLTPGGINELPLDYYKGLLVGDPLFSVATQPDADAIITALTGVGYKAASIPVDKEGPCNTTVILPALADATAFAFMAEPPVEHIVAFYETLVPAACVQLAQGPPPAPPAVVPGTTTPQPGAPLNPGGGWQTRTGGVWEPVLDPTCSTAVSCCYKQKIVWLYRGTWRFMTVILQCVSEVSWSCTMPANGVCPATPSCPKPLPLFPPPPPGPVPCGSRF